MIDHVIPATDWQTKFNKLIEYSLIFKEMAFKDTRFGHGWEMREFPENVENSQR
jgi:hypothetical protein